MTVVGGGNPFLRGDAMQQGMEGKTLRSLGPWQDVHTDAWSFKYFSPYELRERASGNVTIYLPFIRKLENLREAYGKPMIVTSYYRSPAYNAAISATKSMTGPHTTGRAVDIRIARGEAYALTKLAMNMGFTGIGWSQKGAGRYIHIDDLSNGPGQPRPTVWSY